MSNSITHWLNAAGRFPLLSQEEVNLIAARRDTFEVGSKGYIKCINKLCQHNLKLIPQAVQRIMRNRVGFSFDSESTLDYLQQGYIGLRRAAEKYDPARGYKFSTYAFQWMRQSIARWANSTSRTIYVPENTSRDAFKFRMEGSPPTYKNATKSLDVLRAASRAAHVGTIDAPARPGVGVDEDCTLSDLLSEDNLLHDASSVDVNYDKVLGDLMDAANIDPVAQDIVFAYYHTGRVMSAARRLKTSENTIRRGLYKTLDALKKYASKHGKKHIEQLRLAQAGML